MPHVFVAGATGYLGRHIVSEYLSRGWTVTALVRDASRAGDLGPARLVEGQATKPATLTHLMQGVDLVISSLGITRQTDGVGYRDVDYQANLNLLNEAIRSDVVRFAYVHVLGANQMADVPLVQAKSAFVEKLQAAPIASTVIAPSGYFSDMSDFLAMAQSGRVWLFGSGIYKINPIHGADLAAATADAIEAARDWLDVGGPDVFSHDQLAQLAFEALGTPPKISHMPDWVRRTALRVLPYVLRTSTRGPIQFFLSALGQDMVGAPHGVRRLRDHFKDEIHRQGISVG